MRTKLICSWLVRRRDAGCATELIQDLASRHVNRVQPTTDGFEAYLTAAPDGFGEDIDYPMLVKIYGSDVEDRSDTAPPLALAARKTRICDPDARHVSTSYIERQRRTMRIQMRRFTRLTNAFSKKLENHVAAIALQYMH